MMHDMGWRVGEAYADLILSLYAQARGDYALALGANQSGLEIASEIGHQQWLAAHHRSDRLFHVSLASRGLGTST